MSLSHFTVCLSSSKGFLGKHVCQWTASKNNDLYLFVSHFICISFSAVFVRSFRSGFFNQISNLKKENWLVRNDPKTVRNDPKTVRNDPKRSENVAKMLRKCRENVAKMSRKCRENVAKMLRKCHENVAKMSKNVVSLKFGISLI